MKLLIRLSFVIGFVLFALIIWSIDRQRTWEILSGADPLLLLAAVVLISPEALFKALKLRSLARSQSSCSLVDAIVVYLVGIPFGAVTPAKAGDLVKVYSLSRRTRINLPEAFAIGVLDRLLDLLALVVLGTLGALYLLANHAGGQVIAWAVAACVAIVLLLLLVLQRGLITRLGKPVLILLSNDRFESGLGATLKQAANAFYTGIELTRKSRGSLVLGLLFAVAALVALSLRSYVFGLALGLNVAWFNFVLLIPLVTLIELLPISILGFGTREYAMMAIFAFLGVDREQAVSLSLSSFVLSVTPLAVAGYLVAYREHLRPSEVRTKSALPKLD